MLASLFARLTAASRKPSRGAALFAAAARLARDPALYRRGTVPDTLDGRFSALASVVALMLVRIEREGAGGADLSVALTERFVEAMDAEHRELGISDPALGKTVRKLVAGLGRRIEYWRAAVSGERSWAEATGESLSGGDPTWLAEHFRALHDRLGHASLSDLSAGTLP
jgi:cytochrome b pre-mRNA-processing protein 3